MEYIVLASSPGIAIQGLLDLFNNSSGETVFIKFATLRDASSIRTSARPSATRTVFHGIYDDELIKNINVTYPTTKNILLFDTAEAAILQELSNNGDAFSIDSCIDNWANYINQLSLFKEQNPTSSVLIDYTSLINTTAQIIALVNQRLDVQLCNSPVSATSYSSIARLIAAAALINRDEAMVFYDEAKTLALTNQYDSSYTDAPSLVAKQQTAALNEFQALLKCLPNSNPTGNIALAIEAQQSELDIVRMSTRKLCEELETTQSKADEMRKELISLTSARQHLIEKESELKMALQQIQQLDEEREIALLQVSQLQEELEAAQINIEYMQRDINNLANIRQQLNSKQSELEIALLQVNQLQEELEDTLDKYGFFERPMADTAILEKLLGEVPLLGLLRSQANTSL